LANYRIVNNLNIQQLSTLNASAGRFASNARAPATQGPGLAAHLDVVLFGRLQNRQKAGDRFQAGFEVDTSSPERLKSRLLTVLKPG
jgi:hypothetical protein